MRQALPLRGHTEEEGNLRQLLQVCFGESTWTLDRKYLSSDIVNEIMQMMSHTILRTVLNDIRQASWFSIMADETRDIASPFRVAPLVSNALLLIRKGSPLKTKQIKQAGTLDPSISTPTVLWQ